MHRNLLRGCACQIRNNIRAVSTLSPLGVAFNTKPKRKLRLASLNEENKGLFEIPALHDYAGFYLLQQQAEYETERLVQEVTSSQRDRKLVEVFDEISNRLCCVADMADCVRIAHPENNFSGAAEEACMKVSSLVERLNTNVGIYDSLKNAVQNGDIVETDEIDNRVAKLFLFDFEQSGIHLEHDKRSKFVQINEDILELGSNFMQGTQRPVSVPKDQVPPMASQWFTVSGNSAFVTGLFSEHHNDVIREVAYKLYLYPDPRQQAVLEALLSSRHSLAQLVGFPTYAHRALTGTVASSPENVKKFLSQLSDRLREGADSDFALLKKYKRIHGSGGDLMPWDVPYYSGVGRTDQHQVNTSDLAQYFSLGVCMEGLGKLFNSLFGIELRYVEPGLGEVWTPEIYKLAVTHETEGLLGYIYCDFFERRGKLPQDCHFTVQCGKQLADGEYQLPKVVLMLNFPNPSSSCPSLLTPGMVENLFHEFGHALHSMLGRSRYQHVAGTRCATDFAEVPSILMEYFFSDPRVLCSFARHWQTGAPLPEEKVFNLSQAKKMFSACELQQQVFYSALDQVFHGEHPLGGSTTDILAKTQSDFYSLPHVPGTAWHLRFGHFVGYGAKYYSYLMSRAIASNIWHQCFKEDPFSRSMGENYRHLVLAHGGGTPPSDLIQAFLGEAPTTEKLVDSLITDIDGHI